MHDMIAMRQAGISDNVIENYRLDLDTDLDLLGQRSSLLKIVWAWLETLSTDYLAKCSSVEPSVMTISV